MKRLIAVILVMTLAVTTTLDYGTMVFAGIGSSASQGNPASSQMGQLAESAGPVQSFQADLFTGRAQTSIPIFVPPGRRNIQPNLSLSYSSSGGNSWLGVGWALDLGFIQRDVKRGVPKYDSTDKFIFSFQGVSSELTEIAPNEYRAKDEALFLKFVYDSSSNSWVVTDKSGTKHWFGLSPECRQTNSLGTFKWTISKVEDTSGNTMMISHVRDGGEMYLSSIEYNGNPAQNFSPTHKVEFTLEDRPDKSFAYITGSRAELNKRLKEIQVKVKDANGVWQMARRYALSYQLSASSGRSRLSQVTEYGRDGVTSLPPVTFTYQDKVLGFESMSDFPGIQRLLSSSGDFDFPRMNSGGDTAVDMLDINGDGKNDRIQSVTGNVNWKVQLHQGQSFGNLTDFGPLEGGFDYVSKTNNQKEQLSEVLDVNGDGLPDRITAQAGNTSWRVQKNTGSGFESPAIDFGPVERMVLSSGSYDFIRYSPGSTSSETWVDFFDLNGDGLPDRVMAAEGNVNWKVQLSTGSGFSAMRDWGPVEKMTASNLRTAIRASDGSLRSYVDMADLNGDGLPDRVQAEDANLNWKVQWNTGSGFSAMEDFGPIERSVNTLRNDFIRAYTDSGAQAVDLFDLNGDGLPDRVQAEDYNTVWKVQWNTGKGFKSIQDYGPIQTMSGEAKYSFPRWTNASSQVAVDVADLDSDGIPDRIQAVLGNTAWKIQSNKGPYPDLLSVIENGRGGKTTITYTPSTKFDNRDANNKEALPFSIQAVTEVKQEDGMGNSYITNYSYKGGMYACPPTGCGGTEGAGEFRGFREVTVTDAVGTKTIHTFGQTDHNKGKLLTKEVRDSANNLFSKEVTTWNDTHPFPDVHFVHVTEQDNYLYDGDASFKQTRQSFTYDSYGNLASTTEEGDVSVPGDERKTVNAYTYSMAAPGSGSGTYIVNTLKKTTLYGTDLTTVKAERYFYYDSATSIDTAPVKGLLTKEEEWLNTACPTPGAGCASNPRTQMSYDSYGNVLTITDARGFLTTNTYEATYKLFLVTITNALNHTRQFTYDPWLAQILTSTDQNGQITETVYDTLGRVTKVISPLDSSTEPTQEFSYDYPNLGTCGTNCTTKVTTKVKSSVPGQTFTQLITYSFTDGLGREIQRRSPAEDSTKQIVSGIVTFNSRGLVDKQYVPYLADTSTSYVAPDTSKPKATFTYDAVGRRTRIDYPDGTNSQIAFSDFVKTTTDQRGKQLRYTNDAYGRLVKVEEFNSGSTYTTTYEYDVLNNLKKTTDNAGNITTITYDSLSRKTGMTDPDMGTWSYAYDLNDNLISQTDAKNQTISFTYDALNRVTLKDLPPGETDVTYTYDTESGAWLGEAVPGTGFMKGRLGEVTDNSGKHVFLYDALGRVLKDRKVIDSIPYTFARTYDSMGRVRTLTYPDTEVMTYAYNGFGDVETILGVKNSATTNYVNSVDYNASGQITKITYGNNVTSDYTYNPQTLRLDKILTKKPDGVTKLQDLSYTFDPIGNVTHISDLVNSMTQDFTYDDLNRLISATGSAYGTQTFQYDPIGNMTRKNNLLMSYGEGAAGPHAVTSVQVTAGSAPSFCSPSSVFCTLGYDANGNMTQRGVDLLSYDSENRLKEMKTYEAKDGSITYTLSPGWNLISFPYLPADKSISNILSSLTFGTDYDQVSTWSPLPPGGGQGEASPQNVGGQSGTWKHFVNDSDFNDFTAFEYGKSYEIYVTKAGGVSFTVTGKSPATDITHSIKIGDNFISPAVKESAPISTVLGNLVLGTDYSDIKRLNSSTGQMESYSAGAFSTLEPGKGYNIVGLRDTSFSYGKTETVTTFVYDSAGSRIKKTVDSGPSTVYLGKDYEVQGSFSTKYIFLGDRRIVSKDSGGTLLFYHEDHINSSNVITDASGNQAALLEYDPYGSTVTHTGSANPKHKFTGQESDDSTRLYYYGARYYDPVLGRFISADWIVANPVNPQDINRYAYARNNPIRFTDPTGNFPWAAIAAFFAAVAKVAAAVGAVASTASVIARWSGHPHAAQTFGKIAGISAIVAASASLAYNLAGSLASAQASIEISAPPDPEMPRAPPALGEQASAALDRVVEIAGKIQSAVQTVDSVARILGKQIGPTLAYGAEFPPELNKTLRVFSRPVPEAKFADGRHMFAVDEKGYGYEFLNSNSKVSIVKHSPQDMKTYFENWKGQLKGPLYVKVNGALFEKSFRFLQETRQGKPYKWYWKNSNEFIRQLIRMSDGGDIDARSLGCVPGYANEIPEYCS